MDRVPTLLPLRAHPYARPHVWEIIYSHGPAFTVAVDVDHGPGSGRDPTYTAAMSWLAEGGVRLLGYVDLDFATRPVADVVGDVNRWAGYPVGGVFLDHAPASPFAVGPVAVAVQAAQRAGLPYVVLNPGVPPDALYRGLGARICAFEGSWRDYRRWTADGALAGDGHLVHAVPPWDLDEAAGLLVERGAGFGVVTDLGAPDPYCDLPAWCGLGAGVHRATPWARPNGEAPTGDGAGSGGTRTTSGS